MQTCGSEEVNYHSSIVMAVVNGTHSSEPVVKYVGQKVSKVRWKPQPSGAIGSSDVFASGSWNDESDNQVCIWEYSPDDSPHSDGSTEPQLICECEVQSDVTDLRFLDEQRVVGSFSNGCVVLFRYQAARKSLNITHVWERLHHLHSGQSSPCTSLAVCGGVSVVTGGEDGRINVIGVEGQQVLRTIENADNATVTSLTCTLLSEVLSTSSSGQLKVWDLKTTGNKPVKTVVMSGEYVSIQSMDRHPHQPHLVALGREDGSLCFWDLRQERQPVQLIEGHSSDVWEVKFHPSYPNHLFTCSHEGSLWHWDATQNTSYQTQQPTLVTSTQPQRLLPSQQFSPGPSHDSFPTALLHSTPLSRHTSLSHRHTSPPTHTSNDHVTSSTGSTGLTSPWLSGAVHQGKVEIVNYLPDNYLSVNSLDIESRHLVCGSDSEALFVIPNLVLR